MEQWRPFPGFENSFLISSEGRAKRLERRVKNTESGYCVLPEKLVKPEINSNGYMRFALFINLKRTRVFVHRAVATAFIPNPLSKKFVNHKDGNRYNNTISNLEWVTKSENELHAWRILNKKHYKSGKLCTKHSSNNRANGQLIA